MDDVAHTAHIDQHVIGRGVVEASRELADHRPPPRRPAPAPDDRSCARGRHGKARWPARPPRPARPDRRPEVASAPCGRSAACPRGPRRRRPSSWRWARIRRPGYRRPPAPASQRPAPARASACQPRPGSRRSSRWPPRPAHGGPQPRQLACSDRRRCDRSSPSDRHWPLATWRRRLPSTSTTPQPRHLRPGSIPMMRMLCPAPPACCLPLYSERPFQGPRRPAAPPLRRFGITSTKGEHLPSPGPFPTLRMRDCDRRALGGSKASPRCLKATRLEVDFSLFFIALRRFELCALRKEPMQK
jgi:hypothetical protein